MAKQPEMPDFMQMFSQFGKDLKMPQVDVDAILAHHRKNLEALQKAASAGAAGANSVLAKQREALQEGMQDMTEMMHKMRTSGAPKEALEKNAEFARKSFEAAVKHAGEVGEIVRKSGEESTEILRERIKAAMQEIRDAYEKRMG
ncbi:MAG: TIGR01841 family phasin [Rhizobiaceae bacterium]|nr:TIGR01841 family phasin [Rhizobiaceae bacterium]